ncbi:hypothetical protein FIU87_02265 [Bacillus sp. THAF10]|nr:hypothetical protein FIU87_02265 [Bacillus sp. THAF10]
MVSNGLYLPGLGQKNEIVAQLIEKRTNYLKSGLIIRKVDKLSDW